MSFGKNRRHGLFGNEFKLPAISDTYTGLNIVASGVFPVGDWRNQVQTSYMLEDVPSGSYVGAFAGLAQAVAGGAVEGDWYFDTDDQFFYEVDAGEATSTRIYRAGCAMPALIGVVATTSRVIIFDMTKTAQEMWMEAVNGTSNWLANSLTVSSVAFAGSRLYVGSSSADGYFVADFADDTLAKATTGALFNYDLQIASRNSGSGSFISSGAGGIVDNNVNSIATYLSGSGDLNDAGVEIPYVLLGTDGGVSQIDPDGTVYDITTSGGSDVGSVSFNESGPDFYFISDEGSSNFRFIFRHGGLLTADKTAASFASVTGVEQMAHTAGTNEALPSFTKTSSAADGRVVGTSTDNEFIASSTEGLVPYIFNETTPLESLACYIRSSDITGYMKGDIQHASLGEVYRDSDNLISNGTFDDTSTWTLGGNWGIAGGIASNSPAGAGAVRQNSISLTAGVTYAVTFTIKNYSAGVVTPATYNGASSSVLGTSVNANGTYTQFITAASGDEGIGFSASAAFVGAIDNVIVREAVGDERISNGDFASDTVWIDESTGTGTAAISGGQLTLTSGTPFASNRGLRTQTITAEIGKTYEIRVTGVSGTARLFIENGQFATQNIATGENVFYFTPVTTSPDIQLFSPTSDGASAVVDNVRTRQTMTEDGTFDTDVAVSTVGTYWTTQTDWSVSGGTLSHSTTTASLCFQTNPVTVDTEKYYRMEYTISNFTNGGAGLVPHFYGDVADVTGTTRTANGTYVEILKPEETNLYIGFSADVGDVLDIDNVSLTEVEQDLSGNVNTLNIIGELAEAPVAAESELTAVEGFSANAYLESEAGMDGIGTGDFCFSGWAYVGAAGTDTDCIFQRQDPSTGSPFAGDIMVDRDGSENIRFLGAATITSSDTYADRWVHFVAQRSGTTIELFLNGTSQGTGTDSTDYTDANAVVRLGAAVNGSNDLADGKIALFRFSNTVMAAADVADVYRRELQLFQANAKCSLDGTSDAVTGLAYDKRRERVHAATSGGTSVFKDLVRVDTTTNTDAISAHDDATIGDDGSDTNIEKPAVSLRALLAELRG